MGNSDNHEIFAANLKHYMELHGKSRVDICEALNLKYTTFTDWEKGNAFPRIDKIELLAAYFGIQKSDLIEPPSTDTEEIILLNRAAKKMSPENQKKLLDLAKIMFQEEFGEHV